MILVADAGTTFFKVGLINEEGTLVCHEKTVIQNHFASVNETSNWLKAFIEVLNRMENRKNIDAVIVSGNGPTLAPCNGGKAFLYSFEAVEEASLIKNRTGVYFQPSMFLPKALYIRGNEPELWKNTKYFLSTPEFISYQLTGVARTAMPLEGLMKWYWNDGLLDGLGMEKEKFPPFIKSGELLGYVTREASEVFGIKEGTPVLAPCPDFVCAIVGSGAMKAGMVCNRSGTSEGVNYCSSKPAEEPVYMCYRHPNGKDWNISYVIRESGSEIEKARIKAGFAGMSYDEMFRYVQNHEDEKSETIRQVCLKLCEKVKDAIDKVSNGKVSEIRLTGGPAESDYLNGMKAQVTGCRLCTLDTPEVGLSGLGIIAISSRSGEDIVNVADRIVKVKKVY